MPLPAADQVAVDIKAACEALLNSRRLLGGRFSDTDNEWGAAGDFGPCASMQGLRAIFGALAALPEDRELLAIVKPAFSGLLEEWSVVLEELRTSHYGGKPYDGDGALDRLRTEAEKDGSPYTDTVSWALSTSVMLNYVFHVCEANGLRVAPEITSRTREEIARSLRLLIGLQTKDGGWNWGAPSDLNAGHLYFTWSAIQGLADLFDYVIGESENEIDVKPDDDTKAFLLERDASVLRDAERSRDEAARFLRERYVGTALTSTGLSYGDLATKDAQGRERINVTNPGSDIPLLYFYAYLLEALILASYDKSDPTLVSNRRAEMDRLYAEIKRRFSAVRAAGAAKTLDVVASTVQVNFYGTQKKAGKVAEVKVKDPSMWPQILRALVLYPYYVETPRYADEDVIGATGAYALLLDDRRPADSDAGATLWDAQAFNLAISVRALEGLIDVYDYVRLMTEKAREKETDVRADLAQLLADAIYPHVRVRIRDDSASKGTPVAPAAAMPAAAVSDVYIRELALDVADAQTTANLAGAARLLQQRVKTLDVDRAVNHVIGREHETFNNDNPVACDILRSLIIINIATVSQLFGELVQEAIFSTANTKELGEAESSYRGPEALSNRITLAIRQVLLHELSRAQSRDTWDIEAFVRQILNLAPPPPTPQSRATRRGTA